MSLLELRQVCVDYASGYGLRRRVRAVDDASILIERGEIVGLVGESGCGKTTLARTAVGLVKPSSGEVLLDGVPVPARRSPAMRRSIQMVFQDPGSSLDPRHTVERTLLGPLRYHRLVRPGDETKRVAQLLDMVELPSRVAEAKPANLSGGQRQRVAIARAISVNPDIIVADEVVAALDASASGTILNLLNDLRGELGVAVLFISHDLSVVRSLCDRISVMYLGRIVEQAPTEPLFKTPMHPYTHALLESVPKWGAKLNPPALEGDEAPTLGVVPTGCRFHPRCPRAEDICADREPLAERVSERLVECHFATHTRVM